MINIKHDVFQISADEDEGTSEGRTDERGAEERVSMLQLRRIRPCSRELSIEERRP